MIIGGAVQISQRDITILVAVLLGLLLLLCAIGAFTAWVVARRRAAIPLGAMAMLAGTAVGSMIAGPAGLLVGVAASAGAGAYLSTAGGRASEKHQS